MVLSEYLGLNFNENWFRNFFSYCTLQKQALKRFWMGYLFVRLNPKKKVFLLKNFDICGKKFDFWLFAEASYIFSSSKIHQKTNHNSWNQVKQSLPRFFWKLKGSNFSSKALPSFILPYGIRFSNFNLYWGLSVINRRPHLQITGGYSFSTFPSAHLFA